MELSPVGCMAGLRIFCFVMLALASRGLVRFVQTLVQSFSITPAHYQSSAITHDDNVLTLRPGLHFFDTIEIDDCRAMYAHEPVGIKFRFHPVHRFAH